MDKLKKNDLIKARKLCNIFRFIIEGGEFGSNYCNIYPEELQLGKEKTNKNEESFFDLNIKIKDGKFHFGLFDKRDLYPFSIVRMPVKSNNVPSSIVCSAIGVESSRIVRASNNPESFSTAIKPLISRNSSILKFLTKITQILIIFVKVSKNRYKLQGDIFYSFVSNNNNGCYRYADKTVMSVI